MMNKMIQKIIIKNIKFRKFHKIIRQKQLKNKKILTNQKFIHFIQTQK